ncbi:hypothetical protein [Psychrosphaera algicola]|uniref:Uncharacterized protein n=1 Tax=Psychrosphaera algicola TaxID=3023714 RepID=A0ABT5FGR9_9GAMM|nr:hypothetical protein [Psychrosphaera sp. G1-22]MDC2890077.1 hypothetical protein [Psychrosphaera sp. G1-22]
MTTSKTQFSIFLLTLIAVTSVFSANAAGISNKDYAACNSIKADIKRLNCYDKLADRVFSSKGKVAHSDEAVKQAPKKSANSKFGLEHKQYLDEQSAEQITATVTKVKKTAYGHLKIYLDNGQIWKQTTTDRLKLKANEVIVIERAILGSFTLKKANSNNQYKIKRLK